MPRQSVEARAGAAWRSRHEKPIPYSPKHLSPEARKLWGRILASKPADWFDEGNLPILAQYCDLLAEQADLVLRRNELYSTKPVDSVERSALVRAKCEVNKTIREYALASSTLAVKLRLSVQSTIDRRSRILDEKAPEAAVVKARSSLLSGRQLDS